MPGSAFGRQYFCVHVAKAAFLALPVYSDISPCNHRVYGAAHWRHLDLNSLPPPPPHSPFTYLLLPVTCFLLSCSSQVLSVRALLCSCVGTASRLGLLGVCGAPCDLGLGKCGQCRIEGHVCTRGHEKRIAWVVAEVVGMGEPQLHKKVMNFPCSFKASCNEILEHV